MKFFEGININTRRLITLGRLIEYPMKNYILAILLILVSCREDMPISYDNASPDELGPFLPLTRIELKDLSAFETAGTNWSIAGVAFSDFSKEWDLQTRPGSGILVNQVKDLNKRDMPADGEHLFTRFEHGDIELELEVLVPRKSNSGIYFQGRYELQIRDSSDDADVSSDDMGGIYDQPMSDDAKGGGIAPSVNAARQAGLWQKLHVIFRAPRFDSQGKKIANAVFELVKLNGYEIHNNVEITTPTLEAVSNVEVALAPLKIQGNHGPLAIKSFKYKLYSQDKVELKNINYKLYDGKFDSIPDFSALTPVKTGTVENFDNLSVLAGKNEGFCLLFEGEIQVPADGVYLFETNIDDGGDLYINDQLVVHNLGEPGGDIARGTISLKRGMHKMKLSFYQEVWAAYIEIYVEGTGIRKHELPKRLVPKEVPNWMTKTFMPLSVQTSPELVRGFVNHRRMKKTHVLSVGSPHSIHYSYDTRNNQLLTAWKGGFADVAEMWHNRGEPQLLQPLNATLDLEPINFQAHTKASGYLLTDLGYPRFSFVAGEVELEDEIVPDGQGVKRNISIIKGSKHSVTLIEGIAVYALSDGWYSIEGNYYLKPFNDTRQWTIGDQSIKVNITSSSPLSYLIKW